MRFASLASPALSAAGALCGGVCLLHGMKQRTLETSHQRRVAQVEAAISERSGAEGTSAALNGEKAKSPAAPRDDCLLLESARALGLLSGSSSEEKARRSLELACAAAKAAVLGECKRGRKQPPDAADSPLAAEPSLWTVGRVESAVSVHSPLSVDWRRLRLTGGGPALLLSFSFTTPLDEETGQGGASACRQLSSTTVFPIAEKGRQAREAAEVSESRALSEVASVKDAWDSLKVGTPLVVRVEREASGPNEEPRSEAVLGLAGGLDDPSPELVVLGSSGDGTGTRATALGCALLGVSVVKVFLSALLRRRL